MKKDLSRVVVAALGLALSPLGGDALADQAAVGAQPVLYRLNGARYGGIDYFFSDLWPIFTRDASGKIHSNVAVYAVEPTSQSDGYVFAMPGVPAWFDSIGHLHTIDVLREQVNFDGMLLRQPAGRCAVGACVLAAGRSNPLRVSAVSMTGILDGPTLMMPMMRLELKYDELYRRLLAACVKASGADCSGPPWPNALIEYWHNELALQRELLDGDEATFQVFVNRMKPPRRVPGLPHPGWRTPGGQIKGFDDLGDPQHPMLGGRMDKDWEGLPSTDSPEASVAASLSPVTDDLWGDPKAQAGLKSTIDSRRNQLQKAEKDGRVLFPDVFREDLP